MKKTYNTVLKTLMVAGCTVLVSACSMTELDINTNPNAPANASLSLLLPNAELGALFLGPNGDYNGITQNAGGFVGQLNSADDYNLNNNSYNGTWNGLYRDMQNVQELLRATEDGKNPRYRGIALTLKAFGVGKMVDLFGDIPYFDAWKGNIAGTDKNVKFDKDAAIYEDLLKLCDQAVVELAKAQAVAVGGDFLGAGNATTWTRIAKTVKLRLLLNSRKGRATGNADVKAAFAAGGLISSAAQDLVYQYSTQISPQDNRHPWFQAAYLSDNGFTYINHQFMGEMVLNKDPRTAFYFYRQTSTVLDQSDPTDRGLTPFFGSYLVLRPTFLADYKKAYDLTTLSTADVQYLAGLFGRDRADNTGAPADGVLRTAPGAYPAGGLYSGREIAAKALTGGTGTGNGIWPILTSWNLKFYQIEAILDGTGTAGDAKALFEAAMREQIAFVVKYGTAADSKAVAPAAADVTTYVNKWLALYDAATSDQAKLNIVAKQIWFSTWGQEIETWNLMRRTGYPIQGVFRELSTGIQAPILKPKRQYALRLPYPSQEINLNNNATDKGNVAFDSDPIFWDKTKVRWTF